MIYAWKSYLTTWYCTCAGAWPKIYCLTKWTGSLTAGSPCRSPSNKTGAIAVSLAHCHLTCPELYARATSWCPLFGNCTGCQSCSGSSSSCVYWFTRFSLAVRQGTSVTCWLLLLTYTEDPQSSHQAAVTSLCHIQVAILETAFSVAAPREWNRLLMELRHLHSTPLFKCKVKTFLFTAELQNWK